LTFGDDCKITIKSDDEFTDIEWNTLCDKVVDAIEAEYARNNNAVNKFYFEIVFASAKNTSVVLLPNSAAYKCEVKVGDNTIYLRINAISTADLQDAVMALDGGTANQQAKVSPTKGNGINPMFANVNRMVSRAI
jgi:hypothetical protein